VHQSFHTWVQHWCYILQNWHQCTSVQTCWCINADLAVCSYADVKVKVMSICTVPIHKTSLRRSGIARIVKEYQFYLHTLRFIRKQNKPYLPLPSQPQLVLIYRPQRDVRLSRPWCEAALAEIRNYNRPITSPALYSTLPHVGSGDERIDLLHFLSRCRKRHLNQVLTPCWFRGDKNWPAPFHGWMSYKATKPGLVSVLYLSMRYMVFFIMAPFYVLLVFIAFGCSG